MRVESRIFITKITCKSGVKNEEKQKVRAQYRSLLNKHHKWLIQVVALEARLEFQETFIDTDHYDPHDSYNLLHCAITSILVVSDTDILDPIISIEE